MFRAVTLFLFALPLAAQLLPEQRLLDFQMTAALWAKRYAPWEWKVWALGYDLTDLRPWLDRVRNAKDDLEYYEIQAEYGAMLQDTHSYVYMNSNFRADLGITVDIYDGKVLIDSISRARLPQFRYPFAIGDELVSVDGRTAEEWIARISKWRAYGNPATTRRNAAGAIVVRSQSTFPRAPEVGDTASVVIRRAAGELETYELPWLKTGIPVVTVPPVPMPRATPRAVAAVDDERLLEQFQNFKLPDSDPILRELEWSDADGEPRKFVNGIAARAPIFRAGLPDGFVTRLGNAASDIHFSGTYTAGGKTIGYIRIPTFSVTRAAAVPEFDREIDYMQKNTDGLVIDVMRNNGGNCYMFDVAQRLIPYPFYFFGQQIRVSQDDVMVMQLTLDLARANRRDPWIISVYESYFDAYKEAFAAGNLTRPIGACSALNSVWPPNTDNNVPAATVYTKPFIVLIDEFSISAADIFPAMIQDNRRAPLVGMRTSGGGGAVGAWYGGVFSDSYMNNTSTLVIRRRDIVTGEFPDAPYIENIGTRPDIPLDYMTRENLVGNGKPFVDQFTRIVLEEIRKAGN